MKRIKGPAKRFKVWQQVKKIEYELTLELLAGKELNLPGGFKKKQEARGQQEKMNAKNAVESCKAWGRASR